MNTGIVLKAENLVKSYSTKAQKITPVLKGVSLEIKRGEFVAIVGPSGVGKSTLLYLLGSLDYPNEGNIELYLNEKKINYSKLNQQDISALRNKSIGFVFQFHHLLPEFTAIENVMIPALIQNVSFSQAHQKALELIKIVGVEHRTEHKPMELSGGEQQRIAIARALINEPAIVLADEPTGNLDASNAKAVLELIQDLRKKYSLTFIVATHSQEVAGIAERILFMRDGKIVEEKINIKNSEHSPKPSLD